MRSPLVDLIDETKLHRDSRSQWQPSRRRKKKRKRECDETKKNKIKAQRK